MSIDRNEIKKLALQILRKREQKAKKKSMKNKQTSCLSKIKKTSLARAG